MTGQTNQWPATELGSIPLRIFLLNPIPELESNWCLTQSERIVNYSNSSRAGLSSEKPGQY